jgi:predicted nucleic acid-binding protein
MSAIFIDANIPLYATGRPHPLRAPCVQILSLVADRPDAFVTDAEVLQQLVRRDLALHLWPEGKEVLIRFMRLMRDRIEPMFADDVETAASLAERYPGLSARDLVHAAVMSRPGLSHIATADRAFGRIAGFRRLDPADLDSWRAEIG